MSLSWHGGCIEFVIVNTELTIPEPSRHTPMLVVSRKIGERIVLGDAIVVTVLSCGTRQIRLGVEAPPTVSIRRPEAKPRDADNPPLPKKG